MVGTFKQLAESVKLQLDKIEEKRARLTDQLWGMTLKEMQTDHGKHVNWICSSEVTEITSS